MACYQFICIHVAPSGKPQNITGGALNSTSILIQWDGLDCLDRNGVITGYKIYQSIDYLQLLLPTKYVNTSSFTVTHLFPRSNYTFQVAAVNVNGTGPNGTITLSTEAVKSK